MGDLLDISDNLVIFNCYCFRNLLHLTALECKADFHVCICPCDSIKKVESLKCMADYHVDTQTINEFNDGNNHQYKTKFSITS